MNCWIRLTDPTEQELDRALLPPCAERLANFLERTLAGLVDTLLIGFLDFCLLKLLKAFPSLSLPSAGESLVWFFRWLKAGLILLFIPWVYYVPLLAFLHCTVGMALLHLRLYRADGRMVSFRVVLMRQFTASLMRKIPQMGALFPFLDHLWIAWDLRKQSLSDKAASTIVVKLSSARKSQKPSRVLPG